MCRVQMFLTYVVDRAESGIGTLGASFLASATHYLFVLQYYLYVGFLAQSPSRSSRQMKPRGARCPAGVPLSFLRCLLLTAVEFEIVE
jgi:hypothetical protein